MNATQTTTISDALFPLVKTERREWADRLCSMLDELGISHQRYTSDGRVAVDNDAPDDDYGYRAAKYHHVRAEAPAVTAAHAARKALPVSRAWGQDELDMHVLAAYRSAIEALGPRRPIVREPETPAYELLAYYHADGRMDFDPGPDLYVCRRQIPSGDISYLGPDGTVVARRDLPIGIRRSGW